MLSFVFKEKEEQNPKLQNFNINWKQKRNWKLVWNPYAVDLHGTDW